MKTQILLNKNNKSAGNAGGLACITGASSGIGAEFASNLARKGYSLILVARREERLLNLAESLVDKYNVFCEIVAMDLSNLDECYKLTEHINHEYSEKLEVIINCAGFGAVGKFQEGDLDVDMQMIDVNVKALHLITKELLPILISNDYGRIINVASVAGLMPAGPYMATYYATKSYVVSLTRAIAAELKYSHSNVKVHALCPGPVNTEFNDIANVKFALKGISAKDCVLYCLEEVNNEKTIIVPKYGVRWAARMVKFVPPILTLAIIARSQMSKIRK